MSRFSGIQFNEKYPNKRWFIMSDKDDNCWVDISRDRTYHLSLGLNEIMPGEIPKKLFQVVNEKNMMSTASYDYPHKLENTWIVSFPDDAEIVMWKKGVVFSNKIYLEYKQDLWTEEFCLRIAKKYPSLLVFIPKVFQTTEFYRKAVQLNMKVAINMPSEFMPHDMPQQWYDKMVERYYEAVKCIPKEFITSDMCTEVIKKYPHGIYWLPKHLLTDEMYQIAIDGDVSVIKEAPQKYVTDELIDKFFERVHGNIHDIPEAMRTESMYNKYCVSVGYDIKRIPLRCKTYEICYESVSKNSYSLSYVPKAMRDEAMCTKAVESFYSAFPYVPYTIRTKKMCMYVITKYGGYLRNVPHELRTLEMCTIAVKNCQNAIAYVPKHLYKEIKQIIDEMDEMDANGNILCSEQVNEK